MNSRVAYAPTSPSVKRIRWNASMGPIFLKVILHINNMSSQNPLPRSSRSIEKILGVEIDIQSLPIATLRLALSERGANFMCVTIYGTGKNTCGDNSRGDCCRRRIGGKLIQMAQVAPETTVRRHVFSSFNAFNLFFNFWISFFCGCRFLLARESPLLIITMI